MTGRAYWGKGVGAIVHPGGDGAVNLRGLATHAGRSGVMQKRQLASLHVSAMRAGEISLRPSGNISGGCLSSAHMDCHGRGICCHVPMGFLCYTSLERRGNHAPGAVADIATTVANPFNELIEPFGTRY